MTDIIRALNDKISQEKINQSQMAKKLGIKQCLLSQIINNRRKPSLIVTKAIYREYPDLADVLLK
jgi:transcriptional regulator with XRE-family HTH domain